jgi:hypothetical protein
MNTTQSPTQPEFFAASLLVKPSAEAPAGRSANPRGDRLPKRWSSVSRLAPFALALYLVAFFIGVATTLAWQSYGSRAREMIAPTARSYQEQLNAISLDLNAMRQGIDQIATNLDANQEQMRRSVDQLAASHELITRDLSSKLEAVEHNILDKISVPPQRPAPGPPRSPVARPSQVPMVRSGIP